MTRKTQEAIEKTEDSLDQKIETFHTDIMISTKPIVVTGVQRKINIGNYETIDVYCAVSIPQDQIDPNDHEALAKMVHEAADIGFQLTSTEVLERYKLIKEATKKS